MANPTTNYGFVMPTSTDLVTDLPADFDVFGQAVDTQMLTNANAAIAKTIVDAKGDIIAATAADTVSRLAVGANDTVLTADSSTATGLKWATAASGSLTLLSTTSLSGSTTTISSISGAYKNLVIYVKDFYPSSVGEGVILLNSDTTAANYQNLVNRGAATTTGLYADNATAGGFFAGYQIQTSQNDNFAKIEITDYTNTTTKKVIDMISTQITNTGQTAVTNSVCGYIGTTAAITSIGIKALAGTWTAGTVEIYGEN